MKYDWHSITPTGKYKPPYDIAWSPTGHVRAKHAHESIWRMAECSKACYAESIGYDLLNRRRDENLPYVQHDYVPQR